MRILSITKLRAVALGTLLAACGSSEAAPTEPPVAPTTTASAPVASAAPAALPAATDTAQAEAPPAGAPLLPGTEFPSFGTFRDGAPAYFPTMESAEKLRAGNLADAGMTYFRGSVVRHDASTATVTVRDLQSREFDVPASYVLQASEPITAVEAGGIYRGVRFNRPELVMITSASPGDGGRIPSVGLAPFMPDTVRNGADELAALLPVTDGGVGSVAVCRAPNGVRGFMVLRRAVGRVLGFDGSFIRVLAEASCRFAPLRPEVAAGDTIVYVHASGHREATVRAVDASTGAVQVAYPWGAEQREDTARFGSIVRELPPE